MSPHTGSPIRVLLVDDSALVLTILKRMLSVAPEIQVVGTARNGREALELIPQLQPAVICTDLHMPVMDGLELTREVMRQHPRPILVVSVSVQQENTQHIFRLLEAGAILVASLLLLKSPSTSLPKRRLMSIYRPSPPGSPSIQNLNASAYVDGSLRACCGCWLE
jgi:CheY-like chemotaxis protein